MNAEDEKTGAPRKEGAGPLESLCTNSAPVNQSKAAAKNKFTILACTGNHDVLFRKGKAPVAFSPARSADDVDKALCAAGDEELGWIIDEWAERLVRRGIARLQAQHAAAAVVDIMRERQKTDHDRTSAPVDDESEPDSCPDNILALDPQQVLAAMPDQDKKSERVWLAALRIMVGDEGRSGEEVARELGISKQALSKTVLQIRVHLRGDKRWVRAAKRAAAA